MPRPDRHAVAARERQALAAAEHVVVEVAVAGDPDTAGTRHQPGRLGNQQALHFLHG
jgi:hypothetical protein